MGKLLNYLQYLGLNIVEVVAESWVEAEMSWVEMGGASLKLKSAGWRSEHGLVISNINIL